VHFDSLSQFAHFKHLPQNYSSPPSPESTSSVLRSTLARSHTISIPKPPALRPRISSEWVSEQEIAAQRTQQQMDEPLHLTSSLQSQSAFLLSTQSTLLSSAPVSIPARASPSRLARLRAMLLTYVRRLIAFLFPKLADRRTARGQKALEQLQSLADLLRAEFDGEGMDLVAYQVAFGQAYYNVMTASRENYKRHKGKEPEDYKSYFEDFLRQMP
jgi:hypothetical protein